MQKPVRQHILRLLVLIYGLSCHMQANAQCTLAVFANVNASLSGATCTYMPSVASVLSSQNCPGGALVVEAFLGGAWVTTPVFNYTHVNQTYLFRVRDLVSGNSAVGNIKIQDKTAPVITCGSAINVNCENSCATLPGPTVNDCDPNYALTYTLTDITQPCASTNLRVIRRTYKATDAGGNTATCIKTYNIVRRTTDMIVFPAGLTLSVNSTDCSPWCENSAGNPAPAPTSSAAQFKTGVPTINGVPLAPTLNPTAGCNGICVPNCGFTVTYNDVVTTICGSNRRINRTWTVSSACSSTVTYVQTINIYTDGNTSCGQACLAPSGLTYQLPSSTTVRFLWTAPSSCVVRYQVQYRFKTIGGAWGAWFSTTSTTPSLLVTRPVGALQGEYKVNTVCNGVSSPVSATYSYLVGGFFHEATDRSENDTDIEPATTGAETKFPLIWPNPAQGEIHVDLGEALTEPGTMTILTIDGRLVFVQPLPPGTQQASIDLSNQPDGLYLVQVQIAGKVTTERVALGL